MSSEVEDYSDDMKREADEAAREAMGKTQIAFFDITQMGTFTRFIFFVSVVAAFLAIFNWFKTQLVPDEPDFNTARRMKIAERRMKKQN